MTAANGSADGRIQDIAETDRRRRDRSQADENECAATHQESFRSLTQPWTETGLDPHRRFGVVGRSALALAGSGRSPFDRS
jgi:hypothetical protein